MEEWKLIEQYDYSISSFGRVRNNRTGRILKGNSNTFGYLQVDLYKEGKPKRFCIHQLVAHYFLGDQIGKEINHINENKLDNRVENLEYISHKENCNYGTRNNRMSIKLGKPLIQYDLNGNKIRRFNSSMEVQRELGFTQTCISQCLLGHQKTVYGFVWKYTTN